MRGRHDVQGGEFFEKIADDQSRGNQVPFRRQRNSLPDFLDMIESTIPEANRAAAVERQRLDAALAEAERELRERDQDIEQALKS